MSRYLFILIAGALALGASAQAKPRRCAPLLTDPAAAKTAAKARAKLPFESRARELAELQRSLEEKLGRDSNPFAGAVSLEETVRLYDSFAKRSDPAGNPVFFLTPDGARTPKTPTQQLREAMNAHWGRHAPSYDDRLIQLLVEDAQRILAQGSETLDLQCARVGVELALEYLDLFRPRKQEIDPDGKAISPASAPVVPTPTPTPTPQPKKEPPKKVKPFIPKLPKEYRPTTANTDIPAENIEPFILGEAEGDYAYYAYRNFNTVRRGIQNPFRSDPLPGYRQYRPKAFTMTPTKMLLQVPAEERGKPFMIYHIPGVSFLQPSHAKARLLRDETGAYWLDTTLAEVEIPIIPAEKEFLDARQVEFLTRPVGIADSEWTEKVRHKLLDRVAKGGSPLAIGAAVGEFLSQEYLYSVGARAETDPVEALRAGAFQCSTAAFIAVALLRDHYGIPARVVEGYRAKRYKDGRNSKSYLVYPGEAHAWVEFYVDGHWYQIDPTPKKVDRPRKNPVPESPFEPISGPNIMGPSAGLPKSAADHKKAHEETTRRRMESREPEPAKKSDDKSEKKAAPVLEDDLRGGSLSLLEPPATNPFLLRALRLMVREALAPDQSVTQAADKLALAQSLFQEGFVPPEFKKLFVAAQGVTSAPKPEIEGALRQLSLHLREWDPNHSYAEFRRITRWLEIFASTLDPGRGVERPVELLAVLERIRVHYERLNAANAEDIAWVERMVRPLSRHAREILNDDYGLSQVGVNRATELVARAMRGGRKLTDLRLVSALSTLSDFLMDTTPVPAFVRVRTWERDTRRLRGRDFLPTSDPSEIPRAYNPDPLRDPYTQWLDGNLSTPVHRRRTIVPAGTGESDPRRYTVVGYDTSGSMEGDRAIFQANLIASFFDRALSDISPTGVHRHQGVLMGFDEFVHQVLHVRNSAEVKQILRNPSAVLKNRGQGTNIEAFILRALTEIADAQGRNGEPLASANIVVVTDGEAQIDFERLRRARAKIDRRTPVKIMFIALGGTNPELMEYALDSAEGGFDHGYYREFSDEQIAEMVGEAKQRRPGEQDGGFFTQAKAAELSREVDSELENAIWLAHQYASAWLTSQDVRSVSARYRELELLHQPLIERMPRALAAWLEEMRSVFAEQTALSRADLRTLLVDDMIRNFEPITRVPLAALSGRELEHLRWLLRELGSQP